MALQSALDRFRTVLAGATRAIARDAEAEVVYASDASGQSPGKVARVVSPGPGLEPSLVAEARGAADALALRLRHHDPKLHAARAPIADGDARAVFERSPGVTSVATIWRIRARAAFVRAAAAQPSG